MINSSPLISIIIPVYNVEKHLERCVQSVLQQTYKNIEIILVNDGSTDSSLDLCKTLESIDPRITVIDQPNAGVSAARNRGLELASGDLIQFVDSDDFIPRDFTISMLEQLLESKSDMVITPIRTVNEQDETIDLWKVEAGTIFLDDRNHQRIEDLLRSFLLFGPVNKLYKRRLIITFFPIDISYGEDLLFNINYLMHCHKIGITNNVVYNYVQHDIKTSLSSSNQEKHLSWSKIHHRALFTFLENKKLRSYATDKILYNRLYDVYYNEILRLSAIKSKSIKWKYDQIKAITQEQTWKFALKFPRTTPYSRWIGFLLHNNQIKLLLYIFKIRAQYH